MGQVLKLKSGKYAIRFDVPDQGGGRRQKQIGGFEKKKEAEDELKKVEADILRGTFFFATEKPAKEMTVNEFIEIWLRDHVSGLAPKTYDFYDSLYRNRFKDFFNGVALSDLRPNQIERFYKQLSKGELSKSTIHHYHKMLRAALNKAVKWDYLGASPILKVTAPKQTKAEMSYWTEDVIGAAIKLFEGSNLSWYVKVAVFSGLRQGEICALNVNNIDFKNGTFKVTETAQREKGKGIIFKDPKTEKSKATMPLTDTLRELFAERIHRIKLDRIKLGEKYCKDYDGYLSVWEDGHIMDPKYLGKEFHKVLIAQNDIPAIRFHDMRHTCATWLLSQEVDLKIIQEILRHTSFKTTADTYSHVSVKDKKTALDKLTI